jgi:tetratricopeptide (TPR) repeat protein
LEKIIEIKRRAQRCIQNGDLDGALSEYEKLVAADDGDPYNFVLLADLLFKKGDAGGATKRYLAAASAYERASLFKNGIAVCKKMMRLSLAPALVLEKLANLHALDGLATEATLYYQQYAEHLVRESKYQMAAEVLRKAFKICAENVKSLERLGEVLLLADDAQGASMAYAEAGHYYELAGQGSDAQRCRGRAEQIKPGAVKTFEAVGAQAPPPAPEHKGERRAAEPLEPQAPRTWAETLGDEAEQPNGPPLLRHDPMHGSLPLDEPDAMATPGGDETAGPPPLGPLQPQPPLDLETLPAPSLGPSAAEEGPPSLRASHGDAPGLSFEAPAHTPAGPPPLHPVARSEPAEAETGSGVDGVERMLAEAQEHFRQGRREAAAEKLVQAAQTYEAAGQLDHAASIYRSLCRSPQTTVELLGLWFANCERRDDRREAAEVACEIGDRALQDGGFERAREWFERALSLDSNSSQAQRRLSRLADVAAGGAASAPVPAPPPPPATEPAPPVLPAAPVPPVGTPAPDPAALNGEMGRVEVALGRAEAVTFDLGSLLSEFQRGIEAQLSGDAQSHYDLGMTYREMGLLEQAVESFRLAANDAAFQHRCAEMVGRCLLDQGRFDEAANEFGAALQAGDLDPQLAINMRYQLGLALEAAGQTREALAEFERVFAAQANYSDVALKIRVLRRTLEPA